MLLKAKKSRIKASSLYLVPIIIIVAGGIANISTTHIPTFLKILGCWAMFVGSFLSTSSQTQKVTTSEKAIVFIVCFIPVFIVYLDFFINGQTDRSSMFINRNSAGFYCLSASMLLLIYLPNYPILTIVYLAIVMITFSTQGLFVAVIFSFLFIYKKKLITLLKEIRPITFVIIGLLSCIVLFLLPFFYKLEIVSRLVGTITLASKLLDNYSIYTLHEVSYLEAINTGGSPGEISFLFRIKHWANIINHFMSCDIMTILFGVGADNMQNITLIKIRPHNDHLRLLVEFGVLFYVSFSFIIYKLYKLLKKNNSDLMLVPFISVLLYMFTENLIDNFPALVIFCTTLGMLAKTAISNNHSSSQGAGL
jgi:hypothetical protein